MADKDSHRDLGDQRRDYVAAPLRRADLAESPFDQFARWYADAEAQCPGYPNPMVLSTTDKTGKPHSRVVLLKSFDEQGFVFYTNYESDKAVQMSQNPQVSLLFFWEALERQVHIRGLAKKHTSEAADTYFASRPRGSQLSAAVSDQSRPLASRSELETRVQALREKYEGKDVPRPQNWGGYIITPDAMEFWQGQPDRLHDRMLYRRSEAGSSSGWQIQRLSP